MIRTDDVVHLAEQATLGGLLLEPDHFVEVNRWVRGQDFADPWHRMVWTTLREAHAAGTAVGPVELGAQLTERFGSRLADIVRIHDLVRAAPAKPDPRPPARVVVEFGVRRELAAQGVLLEAAAASAALAGSRQQVDVMLRIVAAAFAIAGERWEDAIGRATPTVTGRLSVPLRAAATDLELRRAADKHLTRSPEPVASDAQHYEARLIACLASHPTAIAPTTAWLRPDSLTNPPWRTVYLALRDLAADGRSIDPISLVTEVMRVARTTGVAPAMSEILDAVAAEVPSVPGHLSRIVAGDQLRRTARVGAKALRVAAADPRTAVDDLLVQGFGLLQSMRDLAAALPTREGVPDHDRASQLRALRSEPPSHGADRGQLPPAR
ncbi:MAG: DnaB-like helicase N-terminal domain-containing protein [Cellulomonas sp.]